LGRAVLLTVLLGTVSAPAVAQQTGVRVQVLLAGRAPRMALQARKTSDPVCVNKNPWATEEEALVHVGGGIKNVAVYVSRNAPQGAPRDVELNHQGCTYRPRVSVMSATGSLKVANNDATNHSVHIYKGTKTLVNVLQPAGSPVVTRQFAQYAGSFLRVRCDQHPWEVAFVVVAPSSVMGVTGEQGDLLLPELGPGSYTLTAWHERWGFKTADVTVGPEGRGDVKILYEGNEPRP